MVVGEICMRNFIICILRHTFLSGFYLLIVGAEGYYWAWSHSLDTPDSVRLLWLRDQSVAVASTCRKHNTHTRTTPMHPAGFEPTTPESERSQTCALNRVPTGIGRVLYRSFNWEWFCRRGYSAHGVVRNGKFESGILKRKYRLGYWISKLASSGSG